MARSKTAVTDPRTMARTAQVGAELAETSLVFAEMAAAAQTTIALRVIRMGGILSDPKTVNDPEFRRMGNEKVVAASQAAFALAEGCQVVADGVWTWASMQAKAWEKMTMDLTLARDPAKMLEAQSRFIEQSLDAAEQACSHIAVASSRLAGLGLAPIHKATRANARRLSREAKLPALLG